VRDAALATELVYGVLRRQAQLDWLISTGSGRHSARLDHRVRIALRLGAYQLRFLDRIPDHAVVHEMVELVKRGPASRAAGLVNAVLRRIPDLPPDWPGDATRLSMPDWLLQRWITTWDRDAAESAAAAALAPPPVFIRVPVDVQPPPGATPTDVHGCYDASGCAHHGFRIQDIGSQSIVPLLELKSGHRFLDVCAAPGNKISQAMEARPSLAAACDASPRRLLEMDVPGAVLVRLDASLPLPFGAVFDRILVDAPCSGTGTLARNPEIRWRLKPEDLARQADRQKSILRNALACLKPGGRLVYSTCSLEPEENEEVVNAIAAGRVYRHVVRLPGRDPGDGFQAAVIT